MHRFILEEIRSSVRFVSSFRKSAGPDSVSAIAEPCFAGRIASSPAKLSAMRWKSRAPEFKSSRELTSWSTPSIYRSDLSHENFRPTGRARSIHTSWSTWLIFHSAERR